jgi:hypothetical protein
MSKYILKSILFIFIIASLGIAQTQEVLRVEEMVFCTAIEERQPVGIDTVFASGVERIFCYTKITGAEDTTNISHIWYFNEEEIANVSLSVKTKAWRTWSSKRLIEIWTGKWRVDAVSPSGEVLRSEEFLVKPSAR